MEDILTTLLIILTATLIPLFIVITVFVVMLLMDLRDLVKSYTKLSDTIQKEINPIGDITALPFSSERKIYIV